MTYFEIERGIEITKPVLERTKYPFRYMEVGDSFTIPINKRSGAVSSARAWGDRQDPERRFTLRTIDKKTARIWRVE